MMAEEVAILMTVFNRREKTLSCLDGCFRQIDGIKSTGEYSFTVYLVDDGCTDGTAEAVAEAFPQVHIIRSGGGLFWNQGMIAAWDEASGTDPRFYLWLNDDTTLRPGAFECLLENSKFFRNKAIVVGTTVDSSGAYSYGGRARNNRIVEPDSKIPVPCYTFNGNIVLVPRYVYGILGTLDRAYRHSFGDYDYGARAFQADVPRVVAPGILGECNRNPGIDKWRDGSYSLKERYRYLLSPKGRPPREQFRYDMRSMGFFRAIGHQISITMKVLFPLRASGKKQNTNEQD